MADKNESKPAEKADDKKTAPKKPTPQEEAEAARKHSEGAE